MIQNRTKYSINLLYYSFIEYRHPYRGPAYVYINSDALGGGRNIHKNDKIFSV